jgi:RNA polymerase sigma factor (sigma-70 family)
MSLSPASEVARAQRGDDAAAEALVRRVGRIALPLAAAVLRDRDAAGDVGQDVAVEVLRGLGRLRDPARFDAWVRRIAVRHTLRAAKDRRRRAAVEVELGPLETASEPHAADALAERDALRVALGSLPPRQQLALALRYVHGLTDAEIAAALGCRPGTAASLLSRGRELLRRHESLADLAFTPLQGGR